MSFNLSPRSIPKSSSAESPPNRQESHRIYLQIFAPHSASHSNAPSNSSTNPVVIHSHDSHEVHPPTYPITAPGAPYQFPTSSDSSVSTFASYTFSSISATPASSIADTSIPTAGTCAHENRGSVRPKPSQVKPRYVGYPSTSTTSAAVRLTDRARSKDVTALLRGKFGLPPISIHVGSTDRNISNMQQVLQTRARLSNSIIENDNENEVDVLVLVGTLEKPPKGYIRFEHEEILEEQHRLENFRHFKSARAAVCKRTGGQEMPVSASADTIRASGGEKGQFASSVENFPSIQEIGHSFSSAEDVTNITSGASSTIGLDLSSSRGGNALRTTTWGFVAGGINEPIRNSGNQHPVVDMPVPIEIPEECSSEQGVKSLSLPTNYNLNVAHDYEYDSEPIHIIRTIHPEEHPLKVRDEMMITLMQLRREAECEMGLRLHLNDESGEKNESLLGQQLAKPTFRWFFQPCSALGGSLTSSNSSKIQNIPSYIDLEGYCTGDEETDSSMGDDEECKAEETFPDAMKTLVKERCHIAMLRDLSDPSFVVSGYLLKQSHKDLNVWRRVYCVLGEDRLWTIRRMKTLTNGFDASITFLGNADVLCSLRLGEHSYVKLHRALLLESCDATDSPLGRRLPNAFRIVPFSGPSHTYRAFTASSFKVWTSTLAEKITLKHGDGLLDLANVIAEDEAVARSKRHDDIAISPLLDKILVVHGPPDVHLPPLSADVTRFGLSVAEYRELCRHVSHAMAPHRSYASQKARYDEFLSMVSSCWEDARVVASKSAQLLHSFAAHQNNRPEQGDKSISLVMDSLLKEQKALQSRLGKRWDEIRTSPHHVIDSESSEDSNLALPPIDLFDSLLDMFQSICADHLPCQISTY